MTREEFASLNPGDVLEEASLMPGLSNAPMHLTVVTTKPDMVTFDVMWLGVSVGRWNLRQNPNGTRIWEVNHAAR